MFLLESLMFVSFSNLRAESNAASFHTTESLLGHIFYRIYKAASYRTSISGYEKMGIPCYCLPLSNAEGKRYCYERLPKTTQAAGRNFCACTGTRAERRSKKPVGTKLRQVFGDVMALYNVTKYLNFSYISNMNIISFSNIKRSFCFFKYFNN